MNWAWISSWLESLPCPPVVIEANQDATCVGLGLLIPRQRKILSFFKLNQLWLHRYGSSKFDQIWIEHNDFLLSSKDEQIIRERMLTYLLQQKGMWHELYLGLSNSPVVQHFADTLHHKRLIVSSPNYEVDLTGKVSLAQYLADLSRNTRSQIQRSKKLLMQQGDISLTEAITADEKQSYLADIAALHIDKWQTSEFGSGFTNPVFHQFHQRLIFDDLDAKACHLFCLRLNGEPLAYLYIIKDKNSWYFYLSAIRNSTDNRLKIGLLAHVLVIEHAIKCNITKYSFLAGEARYKRSLSNTPETIQQLVCFYRPTLLLRFRERVRALKRRLVKSRLIQPNND